MLSVLALLPNPLRAGPEIDPLRRIAVQDGGRTKPFDTFARETARRITGARPFGFQSVKGLEPSEWILSMLAAPERWRQERIVKVTHAGLREAAGLPAGKDVYSFEELVSHQGFLSAAEKVHEKVRKDREAKLDPIEREIADLYENLSVMAGIFSGEALHVVPHPDDPKASWYSVADLERADAPQVQRVKTLLTALVIAYRDGDRPSVSAAAAALGKRLAEMAPDNYPAGRTLGIEVHYNRFKPFRTAWLFYLLGFLMTAIGLALGIAETVLRVMGNQVSVATVVLVALLLIFGSQFTLFAMWFDMELCILKKRRFKLMVKPKHRHLFAMIFVSSGNKEAPPTCFWRFSSRWVNHSRRVPPLVA